MRTAAGRRAALVVLAVASVASLLGSPAASQAQAGGSEAFTRLAGCLTDSKRLLVLFLVDTSGSLQDTDPAAQRVVAARVALSGLEALSRSSGVQVDIQLAGFSVGYEPVGTWTTLTSTSLAGIQRSVDTFAQRTTGIDTDYFAALRGAHQQLADRDRDLAESGTAAPCKAVLWFTDGQYDIVDRLTPQAVAAGLTKDYAPDLRLDRPGAGQELVTLGRERLCGATPLVDELRQGGASLFFIALTTQIDPAAADFFDALTTGAGGSVRCGTKGSERTGARLDAANLGDLLAAFDRAASEIGRGVRHPGPAETAVCPTTGCPEGRRAFELDDTIRRFHLLAVLNVSGVALELQGPGGGLRIEPGVSGTGIVGDVPVRWQWASPTAVTVDGDHPASGRGWDGQWSVTFVDGAGRRDLVARTQLYLFSDIVPKLLAPSYLETGRTASLRVGVVSDIDQQVRKVGAAELRASAEDPTGNVTRLQVRRLRDGTFVARYPVPDDAAPGDRIVTLRLLARTRKGVALAPAERSARLPLRVVAYPSVTLLRDRLPELHADARTEATVVVLADRRAAACVWNVGSKVDGPGGAGEFTVEVAPATAGLERCLNVPAGRARRMVATIDAEHTAKGTVRGTLRVAAVSQLNSAPQETELSYRFQMSRPVNATERLVVFFALMLFGVFFPVVVGTAVHRWKGARRRGLTLSFPHWLWSRSFGRGWGLVRGWSLSLGGWVRNRLVTPGWRIVRSWGLAVGGWVRNRLITPSWRYAWGSGGRIRAWGRRRLIGLEGDDAPSSLGGMLRRLRRRKKPVTGGETDEWGVPLEDDGPRDRIHISVLLDRSESMTPLVRDVVEGCNTFLAVHRAEPGPARLTLAQFDLQDPLEILLDGVDLAEAPDLTTRQFRPRGVTPLYDAIGALIDRTEAEAVDRVAEGLQPEDQLFVVLTDGRDNASTHYSRVGIANRIRTLEARGWTFVFLGANQDAYAEGASLGIARGSTSEFAATDTGVRKAWANISRATLVHRRKRSAERAADRLDFFRGVRESEREGARSRRVRS